jgi:hypothetical protein
VNWISCRHRWRDWSLWGLCIAVALGAAACETTPAPGPTAAPQGPWTGDQPSSAAPLTPDEIVATDPCVAQMHDIAGAMLLFFAVNKHLPPTLEDLKSMADADAPLVFTCPTTGQPYVYVPSGLGTVGTPKHIILYAASPDSHGRRWCILMSPPPPGFAASQTLEVVPIPEAQFHRFYPMD